MWRTSVSAVIIAFVVGLVDVSAGSDTPQKDAGVKVSGVVYTAPPEGGEGWQAHRCSGAAVHIRDVPAGWNPGPSANPVELKFIKGRLVPEFACIQVGQMLLVKCPEGEVFNLIAHSRARGDFGRFPRRDPKVFTDNFPKSDDFVSLVCNIHATAKAQIQVVPTPGFVLCDTDGKFTLPRQLPKGEHVLRGFFPSMGWGEKTIRLQGDEGEISVELALAPRKAKAAK